MKQRLAVSLVVAFVYTATYAGVLVWQNKPVKENDLILGAVVFAVTFYTMRTWLRNRRN